MPKSIIDINVNDSSFKEFSELFEKYQAKVQKLPGAWGSVNKEVQSGFEAATAALLAQGELHRRAQDASKDEANHARTVATYWKEAAGSAGTFASSILKTTQSLIKWTGITSAVGGILGLGGLWGLERLAGSVGAGLRVSQGLGLTTGEQKSFGLNFGRVLANPEGVLSDVNEALHDPNQLYRLYAAGIGPGQITGKDTGQVSAELLDSYRKLAQQTPASQLGAVLRAHGGLISLNDFEALKSLTPDEYGTIRKGYGDDAKLLTLSHKNQLAWQGFDKQLNLAGQQIENAFITGLTPLIPQLSRFSGIVAGLVTGFLKWADQTGAVDRLGVGLKHLGDFLISKEFSDDMTTFKDDVVALAEAIHAGLVKLGLVAGASSPKVAAQKVKQSIVDENPEVFGKYAGLLPAISQAESGGNPNAVGPRTNYDITGNYIPGNKHQGVSALGEYQLMPYELKDLGVTDPFNPAQSKHGAAVQLGNLAGKYGGDVVKMLAGYNWGAGNLDTDIKRHGADWYAHLPKETSAYITKILHDTHAFFTAMKGAGNDPQRKAELMYFTKSGGQPKNSNPGVNVYVYNNTGGNAIVSAGQLAR